MKPTCNTAIAPEEVTVWFLRPLKSKLGVYVILKTIWKTNLEAKNTGRAKHASQRKGDTPFELAVQLPVTKLAKT